MTDDLSVALERLRTSTQRLNTICDAAAQAIKDAEAFLEDLGAGIEAWVEYATLYTEDEDGRRRTEKALTYQRVESGKFRIAVVDSYYEEESFEGSTVRPWSECTRKEKLDSFEKLPALLVEIGKKADEQVARAEKALIEITTRLPLPKKRKGGEK